MPHWLDTYPHTVYASVILKDNKIVVWKVGQYSCKDYLFDPNIYTVQEQAFVVNSSEEHNRVFEKDAKDWFRQWDLHEDFRGMSPFEDIFTDNRFCPVECEFLFPKEYEQSKNIGKASHICTKYNKRVIHGGYHPNILKCDECKENKEE